MPKVLVTRWKRKKPVYLSSPLKGPAKDVEPTDNVLPACIVYVLAPASETVVFTVCEKM